MLTQVAISWGLDRVIGCLAHQYVSTLILLDGREQRSQNTDHHFTCMSTTGSLHPCLHRRPHSAPPSPPTPHIENCRSTNHQSRWCCTLDGSCRGEGGGGGGEKGDLGGSWREEQRIIWASTRCWVVEQCFVNSVSRRGVFHRWPLGDAWISFVRRCLGEHNYESTPFISQSYLWHQNAVCEHSCWLCSYTKCFFSLDYCKSNNSKSTMQ